MKHGTDDFPFAVYEDRYYNSYYPWHWHDELEIGYARKGRVFINVNKDSYIIEEGNGIFINNGILHSLAGKGSTEVIFPNILFHASLVYGSTGSVFHEKYMNRILTGWDISCLLLDRDVVWQRRVLELVENCICAEQDKRWGYEFKIREILTEITLLVLDNCYDGPVQDLGDKKSIMRIRCMVDYIRKHYAEDISLKDIAASASIGERECLRCFHDFIKKPPKQYVTEIRVCNARRILASTTLSMREVGEMCGFQSASYFSKVFHDYSGVSPREYQKNLSQGNKQDKEISQTSKVR